MENNGGWNQTICKKKYCQVGDKVFIVKNEIFRKLNCATRCPYHVSQIYSNGTVHVQNDTVTKYINIWHCSPYTDLHKVGEEYCGSSSDTTVTKSNPYYLIDQFFLYESFSSNAAKCQVHCW